MTEPDFKAAAVEQWTNDPIAANLAEGEPGTRSYFESLLAARADYAPWMAEVLGYGPANPDVRGLRVLDVGCGQAIDLAGYARAGADATGVDLTPRHVELAGRNLEAVGLEAETVLGDAERLPFEDASFDRVSSNGVLHHTPDMPGALREIRRVLRPDGEARIIVYNKASLHYWLNQVLYLGVMRGGLLRERSMAGVLSSGVEFSRSGARPLVRVYTRRDVRRMLRHAGFAEVRAEVRHFEPGDAFPYAVLASRVKRLTDPKLCDRIGRLAGWYVVGRGIRPAE